MFISVSSHNNVHYELINSALHMSVPSHVFKKIQDYDSRTRNDSRI